MKTPIVLRALTLICLLNPIVAHAQWAANGKAVCTLPAGQNHPAIVPDGSGGAIIVWEDSRNSGTSGIDLYAQRVNANGYPQWTAGGVAMCTEPGDQLTTNGETLNRKLLIVR